MSTPDYKSGSKSMLTWMARGVLEDAFRNAIREEVRAAVSEAHDGDLQVTPERSDDDRTVTTGRSSGGTGRSSGGRGIGRLLLVGVAAIAVGYLVRNRSETVEEMLGGAPEQIRRTTEETGERTEEMSERAGGRVREGGREMATSTETMAGTASEGIRDTGRRASDVSEDVAERVEERGDEVGDRIEEGSESAGETVEETGTDLGEEMETTGDEETEDEGY